MACFGVIISNRSFFPDHLVLSAREKLLERLGQWGHRTVALSPGETPMGETMTREEALRCAALFRSHADEVDGVIVCLPNFGEESAVTDALRMSRLNVPVLIQACEDELERMDVAQRRDAYCGKLSLCASLYQSNIPYTLTERHVCALDSDAFARDVERFARVCAVVRALRGARIAQIGTRISPFRTVRSSEKLLETLGVTVETVDMAAFLARAAQVPRGDSLARRVDALKAYARVPVGVEEQALESHARFSLALDGVLEELDCSACALACWDSVHRLYGCAPCLAMSYATEHGVPCACETDVMGALSMLALRAATGVPPTLQDWDNNYGHVADRCVNIHCSNFPAGAFDKQPELCHLDILGSVLGDQTTFGALKGRVKAGDMTYLRLSTDDRQGKVRGYLGEGAFTEEPLSSFGGVSVCQVPRLNELMRYLAANGFEHHVAMVHGLAADALEEALVRYVGIELYRHR